MAAQARFALKALAPDIESLLTADLGDEFNSELAQLRACPAAAATLLHAWRTRAQWPAQTAAHARVRALACAHLAVSDVGFGGFAGFREAVQGGAEGGRPSFLALERMPELRDDLSGARITLARMGLPGSSEGGQPAGGDADCGAPQSLVPCEARCLHPERVRLRGELMAGVLLDSLAPEEGKEEDAEAAETETDEVHSEEEAEAAPYTYRRL
jgi:hypothetical protein